VNVPKFSIIIPTYNRADGRLQRALDSVQRQVCQEFECIIVDDASDDDGRTERLVLNEHCSPHYNQFKYIRHEQRQGRVIARNTGMKTAIGERLCWLDSDDIYDPMYLATFAHAIEQEPEARLFVCGAIVHGMHGPRNARICPAWTKIRPAWMPPVDANGRHAYFDSGKIGTGMFVFHRECYEEVGPLPLWQHPDHIADGIDEWLGLPYGTLGYGSGKREREVETPPLLRGRGVGHIGDPWGDDHCYMLALARRWQVHLIHAALYVQYIR